MAVAPECGAVAGSCDDLGWTILCLRAVSEAHPLGVGSTPTSWHCQGYVMPALQASVKVVSRAVQLQCALAACIHLSWEGLFAWETAQHSTARFSPAAGFEVLGWEWKSGISVGSQKKERKTRNLSKKFADLAEASRVDHQSSDCALRCCNPYRSAHSTQRVIFKFPRLV